MPDIFDELEGTAPLQATAPVAPRSPDIFDELEQPAVFRQKQAADFTEKVGKHVNAYVEHGRSWEQTAESLKNNLGLSNPELARPQYEMLSARQRALEERQGPVTAKKFVEEGLGHAVPFLSDLVVQPRRANAYVEARQRAEDGKATRDDYDTIAKYDVERETRGEMGKSFLGKALMAGEFIPKVIGEGGVAGKALGFGGRALGITGAATSRAGQLGSYLGSRALMTPLMPSMYMPEFTEKNVAELRKTTADDLKNMPTPLAMGYLNNVVLGSFQPLAKNLPGNRIIRSLGAGAIGTGEAGAVGTIGGIADEFLPDAYKTHTEYGTWGNLARGLGGNREAGRQGLQQSVIDFLSFSMLAGMHGKKPEEVLGAGTKTLNSMAARGLSAEAAARELVAKRMAMEKEVLPEPKNTPAPTAEPQETTAPAAESPVRTPEQAPTPPEPAAEPQAHPLESLSNEQLEYLIGYGGWPKMKNRERMLERISTSPTVMSKGRQMVADQARAAEPPPEPAAEAAIPPSQSPAEGKIGAPERSQEPVLPDSGPVEAPTPPANVVRTPPESGLMDRFRRGGQRPAEAPEPARVPERPIETGPAIPGEERAGVTEEAKQKAVEDFAKQDFGVSRKGNLTERERFVMDERAKGVTQEAIGQKLGITRERVRQIEAKARAKMEEPLTEAQRQRLEAAEREAELLALGRRLSPKDPESVINVLRGKDRVGKKYDNDISRLITQFRKERDDARRRGTQIGAEREKAFWDDFQRLESARLNAGGEGRKPEETPEHQASDRGPEPAAGQAVPGAESPAPRPPRKSKLGEAAPKLTKEERRAKKSANLVQNKVPQTLLRQIQKGGGLSPEKSLSALGLTRKEAEEMVPGIFRDANNSKGTRHVEDVIAELQRSGDLPSNEQAQAMGKHPTDILIEKLRSRAPSAEGAERASEQMAKDAEARAEAEHQRKMVENPAYRAKFELQREELEAQRKEEAEAEAERKAIEAADREIMGEKPPPEPDFGYGAMYSGLPWPTVSKFFGKISDALFGKAPGQNPSFAPSPHHPDMPADLPADGTIVRQAANQLGARKANPFQIASTALAYSRHVADSIARAWRITRPEGDPFSGDPAFHDRIEAEQRNPGSQKFTPEEQKAFDMWQDIRKWGAETLEKEGVRRLRDENTGAELTAQELVDRPYMHRAFVPDVGSAAPRHGIAAKPGSKASMTKQRKFDTSAEGVAEGVVYKPFYDAVADYIHQVNKTVADHRFSKRMGGEDLVKPLIRRKMAESRELLAEARVHDSQHGTSTEQQLKALIVRDAYESATANTTFETTDRGGKRPVSVTAPAFRGKLYSEEAASHIEKMYGDRMGDTVRFLETATNNLRGAVLAIDASWSFLQMQGMLFTNPKRWAAAMKGGLKSALWDGILEKYARVPENAAAMNERAQAGGGIANRMENIPGAHENALIRVMGNLPLVGKGIEGAYVRAERAMTAALEIAKNELWKANRPADPKEWPRAVEALEDSLGFGRMEQLGMRPERALVERIIFLAPSYYRAHKRLAEQLFRGPGAQRRIAMKQLGGLAMGVFATSLGMLYAARMAGWIDDDELEERLNPRRGKFLTVPIPVGDGSLNVGFGGFYMNMMRTLADVQKYDPIDPQWQNKKVGEEWVPGNPNARLPENRVDHKKDVWSRERTPNPIVKWYRGHAGSVVRLGMELEHGEDYGGRPTTMGESALRAITPIAGQDIMFGDGTIRQRLGKAATGLLGLRSFKDYQPVPKKK